MKVLLLQGRSEIRDKLVFNVECVSGAQVLECSTIEESLKIANAAAAGLAGTARDGRPDLIIVDLPMGEYPGLERLAEATNGVPCIICVDPELPRTAMGTRWQKVEWVDRRDLGTEVSRAIARLAEAGEIRQVVREEIFCKVRTQLLLAVCPLRGDVYIRLSEAKFVKLFHEGAKFEESDREKYTVKKGVEFLYLRKDQVAEFAEKYNDDLRNAIARAAQMLPGEATKIGEEILETAQSLGQRVGFTKEVQALAKNYVNLAVKSMGRSPSLAGLLDRLKQNSGQYLSAHSTLCAYTACAIATQMEWGSEATFQKLSLAAFLHDITLTDHRLAACETLDEATQAGFSEEQIKAYKLHAIKAAEVVRQYQEVPPDVDAIIIQHHERPDGLGFPRGLAPMYMSPLGALFVVAHDMAKYALKMGPNFVVAEFVKVCGTKYRNGQYRKVFEAVERL